MTEEGPPPEPLTEYLSAEDVLQIAEAATGGPAAVRDLGLVDSACHRPQATVFSADAYPTLLEKAAALLHSLTNNHPFLDGNKRTAWLSTVVFLRLNGHPARTEDGYDSPAANLVLDIAAGRLREVGAIAERLADLFEH